MANIEKLRVGEKYDKRIKLTKENKEEIKARYEEENISQRQLAKIYNVDKKTISFIVNKDKLEYAREYSREYSRNNKTKKEKRREYVKRYRKHKRDLLENGKIQFDKK